jgi:glucokinase
MGLNLVADIGGTNVRFALAENTSPALITATISVTSLVSSDQLMMTNHCWNFSISETR